MEKVPKKGWLPKKEYLAKLAEDRAATARETAKRPHAPQRSKKRSHPRIAIRRRNAQLARQLRTSEHEDVMGTSFPPLGAARCGGRHLLTFFLLTNIF